MKARDVLAILRLEDDRRWIDAAHDFQRADALAVLEGKEPYNFLTRARGGSKTSDLAGAAVSDLLVAPPHRRLYWLAADAGQGGLAIDAISGYTTRTPGLADRVSVQARRVVAVDSGASLEVLPADAPGAWGLLPWRVYVDELAQWAQGPAAVRLWEAVSSAVTKHPEARLVVLTTAGDPQHFAAKVLAHARTSPLWRVHEVPGPAPWMDPARIAEQRARLPLAVFEQLFENKWVAAEGSFLDPAAVDRAFTLDGPAVGRVSGRHYVAGLDLGHVNDRSVFALGHREGEQVHLDRLQVWAGSSRSPVNFGEVERFVLAAHERFRCSLRFDPWQAISTAQRLRDAGVRATEFNFSGSGAKQRLAATLLEGINGGTLKFYEADGLRDELIGLRVKQTAGGAWTFDHQSSGHDDRAVAIALMAVEAVDSRPNVVQQYPYRDSYEEPTIARAGFRLQGEKYLDRDERGRLVAPPGWSRA